MNQKRLKRNLKHINLHNTSEEISLETYWCRVVSGQEEAWNHRPHKHSFFEFHLLLKGRCTFDLSGKQIILRQRQCILVAPHKEHTLIETTPDLEKLVWGFSVKREDVAESLSTAAGVQQSFDATEEMLRSLNLIFENEDLNSFGSYFVVKSHLYYLFVLLVRRLTDLKNINPTELQVDHVRIQGIRKFIGDNLEKGLSAKDVASQFYLSERQLTRICLSACGKTPATIKRELQLELIRTLLKTTEMTLSEVAAHSGFADSYSMSKFFKREEGVSPTLYRKDMKK